MKFFKNNQKIFYNFCLKGINNAQNANQWLKKKKAANL